MQSPKAKAWIWLIASVVIIGLVLFVSAGTVQYWQAWVYLAVMTVCSVPVTLYMIATPSLLESRTKFGPAAEQRPIQRIIVLVLFLPTIATFVIPGLDRRFHWSSMPAWLPIVGDLLIAMSIWISSRVFKANSFGSSTLGW